MSKIARKPILLPAGVEAAVDSAFVTVKGPKGELRAGIVPGVKVEAGEGKLSTRVENPADRRQKAMWGTMHSLLAGMVEGVTSGFEKKLEIVGVGYRAEVKTVEDFRKAYEKKKEEAREQGKHDAELMAEYALGLLRTLSGKVVELLLGYSHPIFIRVPESIGVTVEKNVITVSGTEKQTVGQFAAELRSKRQPEPYKGKGIKYSDETVRRKAGKVVKAVGG